MEYFLFPLGVLTEFKCSLCCIALKDVKKSLRMILYSLVQTGADHITGVQKRLQFVAVDLSGDLVLFAVTSLEVKHLVAVQCNDALTLPAVKRSFLKLFSKSELNL